MLFNCQEEIEISGNKFLHNVLLHQKFKVEKLLILSEIHLLSIYRTWKVVLKTINNCINRLWLRDTEINFDQNIIDLLLCEVFNVFVHLTNIYTFQSLGSVWECLKITAAAPTHLNVRKVFCK